jgi:hypothetical protein
VVVLDVNHSIRPWLVAVLGALVWADPAPSLAQEPPDSIRAELARLRTRIDSLEAIIRRLQDSGQEVEAADALADLRAAAAAAARAGRAEPEAEPDDTRFAGRQRALQALNPEISVSIDWFGHLNPDDPREDNFIPREFEFSFQGALDPYSRAKVFVSHHSAGPETIPFGEGHGHDGEAEEDAHGGGLAVEEGYLEWVGLPGGVSLKLGQFFQRFGALNRWHAHALPFQSRSLPHLAFLGEEALAQAGASATWLAPFGGSGAYEATVEVTRSSNEALFGESTRPNVLGHVNAFWQFSEATDLDLGLSWVNGSYEDEEHFFDRNLFGAEAAFTWRPPERARYRGVTLRGGVMVLDGLVGHDEEEEHEEEELEELEPGTGNAVGLWSAIEVRVSDRWLLGGRFDRVENPAELDQTAWIVSPTLTWWQSEWVRVRVEYDVLGRSFQPDDEARLWLWVTVAMGPHKHETY